MSETAGLLESVADVISPLLAAVLVWRLLPSLAKMVESRSFTIEVASMKISAQEATDQIATQIKDLQDKVVALETRYVTRHVPEGDESAETTRRPDGRPGRILWVDDNPNNNAFEIAKLNEDGWDIARALTTDEAVRLIDAQGPFAAIVSDMGRSEADRFVRDAGIQLIRRIRATDREIPIFIYSSQHAARTQRSAVVEAGGTGITSSPVELFRGLAELR